MPGTWWCPVYFRLRSMWSQERSRISSHVCRGSTLGCGGSATFSLKQNAWHKSVTGTSQTKNVCQNTCLYPHLFRYICTPIYIYMNMSHLYVCTSICLWIWQTSEKYHKNMTMKISLYWTHWHPETKMALVNWHDSMMSLRTKKGVKVPSPTNKGYPVPQPSQETSKVASHHFFLGAWFPGIWAHETVIIITTVYVGVAPLFWTWHRVS